ncbi:MAG: hypothetical protein QMC85_05185, partial [Methanocellales archaeon]|nr:hypothetical protein [Methanocellales archaeon]
MVKEGDGKDLIVQLQNEIKQQREIGGLWEGYCNLQKIVSGDIWESSTRYVYELLQNAEDAKATEFQIYISKERAKIVHNGEPFTSEDVRSLCYALSKKDPNESIGYLGVGFRSVFPITDRPEIYSGDYSFRFDKEECVREFNESTLYYFYPYWIEQPTEMVDHHKTTIILPFKTKENFHTTIEQLKELGIYSLLFLRHIKSIIIQNEESNESRVCNITCLKDFKPLNNKDIKVGKFQLVDGNVATRFLVFRATFQVPDEIREDEETQRAKRGDVKEREISIGIRLDEQDNLKTINGYLCSFFPLMERKTNFLVHADFIVQAGRIALLDNKWNMWMMKKAREIALASYLYFQDSSDEPKWAEQFPSIFERREEVGEIYEEIFEKPLQDATENPMVTDIEGKRVPLDKAIKITEETDELVKRGFIKCEDLKVIFGKEYHLIRKDYLTGGRHVKELKIDDFNSEEFINGKIKDGVAIDFLSLFYPQYKKAMVMVIERQYSRYLMREQQSKVVEDQLGKLLVIDRNKKVRKQDEVWAEPDVTVFEELRSEEFDKESILSQFDLVDEKLWEQCKEYLPKIKRLSRDKIIKEAILPTLKITSARPSKEDIVGWTYLLKRYNVTLEEEIWVLDTTGEVRSSKEVFLSDKYNPLYHWQKFGFSDMNFVSEEYLEMDEDADGWKKFFQGSFIKGYDKSDFQNYVENNIFPILKNNEAKSLANSEIIQYTRALKECNFIHEEPIFVVTKDGEKQKSDSGLYLSSQYSPTQNWENQKIISIKFVSPEYIGEHDNGVEWKDFFKKLGVKEEAPHEMIEEFGKAIVKGKFEKDGYNVSPYGGLYDLVAEKGNETFYIEVKSTTSGDISDENFDSARTKFAQEKGECYC